MAKGAGKNPHRHCHIEGHCNNIHKEKSEWDSGLETAMAANLLTRTQAGPQCPGSSLKKSQEPNSKYLIYHPKRQFGS